MKYILAAYLLSVALLTGCNEDPEAAANKLFVEASPLWSQYQALPENDPAHYEERLKLLTQIASNLSEIVNTYPESSLAVELASSGSLKNLNKAEIDGLLVVVDQSIPASALMLETLPLWAQYQALPEKDPGQYEARLKLLTQIDANLEKLLREYPESYEATGLEIDSKAAIIRVKQSVPASALMSETLPLWAQYQALPENDPGQYEARLKLLTQIDANLEKLLREYPQSYEVEYINIKPDFVKNIITNLGCLANEIACARKITSEAIDLVDGVDAAYARSAIAGAQASSGDIADALETAASINDFNIEYRTYALSAIAGAQHLFGDVEGAKKTIENAVKTEVSTIDPYKRSESLIAISRAQFISEDVEGAEKNIKIARGILNGRMGSVWANNALAAIAGAQASARDIAAALITANSIDEVGQRAYALSLISGAQAAAGDVAGAEKTLAFALDIAEHKDKASVHTYGLSLIARAQATAGDVTGAEKTIIEAREAVKLIETAGQLNYSLSSIAVAQAINGDIAGALETAKSIDDIGSRSYALATVAESIAKIKKP